jgi:hypothetical protein
MLTRFGGFALVVALGPAVAAHAQSFDGVYKGMSTLTKITRIGPQEPNCPPVGHKMPVVFKVARQTITGINPENNKTSSGKVAADGTFKITYTAGFWGGGPGSGRNPVTWSGRILGTQIEGAFVVTAPSGQCSGTITAQK